MKWKGPHFSDSQTQPLLKGFCCNSDGDSASWTSLTSFVSMVSIFASSGSTPSFNSGLASSSSWGGSDTKTPSSKVSFLLANQTLQMPAACTLQPEEPTPCPASSASSFSSSFAESTAVNRRPSGKSAWLYD